MKQYKEEYNSLLKRYYAGCNYLKEHPDTLGKYLPEILKILEKINNMIEKYDITDSNVILRGFKEED